MASLIRKPNKYIDIFRALEGDADLRVKIMLKKYGETWGLEKSLIKNLLSDPNTTAEDIIDTLKVFSADFASNIELRLGLGAMDSGTQKMRRENLVAIDKAEPELDHPDIRKTRYHRYRAA